MTSIQRSLPWLALLASLLAGCGGGGSGGAATAITTAAPAAAAAPVTPAATTVAATATVASLSAASAAFLDLDLASLPDYTPVLPAYYDAAVRAADNTPGGNALSNPVASLGRVLFYDKRLSVNNTIACASCHQQALGFSDGKRFSVGFAGNAFTTAHSMRLGNVRYYAPGDMFWDRRAATLEAQATQPIQHPVEMGFDASNGGIAALLARMRALPYYPELFGLAYGDAQITEDRIQRALAQFQRAMVSTGSRWDEGYAQVFNPAAPNRGLNADVPGLSAEENRGRQLFMGGPGGLNCAACHAPPSFALTANSRSNGLDAGETTLFKAPSLKNAGLSTAFMHDGRFATLEQVVEHYNSGVQDGPALDNRLRGPGPQPRVLNLAAADKAALAAFLRTLTDTALLSDRRFSDPFKP